MDGAGVVYGMERQHRSFRAAEVDKPRWPHVELIRASNNGRCSPAATRGHYRGFARPRADAPDLEEGSHQARPNHYHHPLSSLKFSLYAEDGAGLALVTRGQAEGLFTSPRFVAKTAAATGDTIEEKKWDVGASLGHAGALDHLIGFIRRHFAGYRLAAVGHRVVHGGLEYSQPTRVTPAVIAALEKYVRTLEASREPSAREAIDLFVYRIGRELGSLAAALGGLDAIVFTAGIGERQPLIARACVPGRSVAWSDARRRCQCA